MSVAKPIQLGLCCINTILRAQKPPVFASRSIILKTFEERGFEHLRDKIIQNLKDVLTMMEWNDRHGIRVYRLSSDMFPHLSNMDAPNYTIDFAKDLLREIGNLSRKYGQRLTFHPGQYNVIGTPNPEIFAKTAVDLRCHAAILDAMDLGADSVIVIHGGGVYGDKQATIDRWCEQFMYLDDSVRRRIVLENCEKNFSVVDCLEVSDRINIPVVFDTHHFECYKLLHPGEQFETPDIYMHAVLETWWRKGIKPKFHVSEQGSGKTGHHSDFIETIPDYLLDIPEKFGCDIDIMIEAKQKEQAIIVLYKRYPGLDCRRVKSRQLPVGMQWTQIEYEECGCC